MAQLSQADLLNLITSPQAVQQQNRQQGRDLLLGTEQPVVQTPVPVQTQSFPVQSLPEDNSSILDRLVDLLPTPPKEPLRLPTEQGQAQTSGLPDMSALLGFLAESQQATSLTPENTLPANTPKPQQAPASPQQVQTPTPAGTTQQGQAQPAQQTQQAATPVPHAAEPINLPETEKLAISDQDVTDTVADVRNLKTQDLEKLAKGEELSFFEDPAKLQLLLGFGIGMLQGRDLGTSVALGVSMMDKFKASQAAGVQAGREEARADKESRANVELTKAKTKQALADATKTAKETGIKGDTLKGYRKTFSNIVGEQPIGDEDSILFAQAQAATQELAAEPTNKALQKLQKDSLQVLFNKAINIEDEDERNAALDSLGNRYPGFDFKQFF